MRLGRRLLVPRLDRTHLDRRLRQMSEQLALPRADFAQQRIRLGDIGSAARVGIEMIEARVATPEGAEGLTVAREADLFHDRAHTAVDARGLLPPHPVDVCPRQADRWVTLERNNVP